jgi:glycosyltransferase involved in cell wall biosynthesis
MRPGRGSTREAVQLLGDALLTPDLPVARRRFEEALRRWAELAPTHDLEDELVSRRFVGRLLTGASSEPLAEQWRGRGLAPPTVGDALATARLVAHTLRPLHAAPPQVDLVHLVANGVAGLVGLSAGWRYGTPYVLSEHGVYLRERYLSFSGAAYSWPAKWLMMRFYRLLVGLVYSRASLVAPGNVYNRRWEQRDGVPASSIRTVYNGVDPEDFVAAGDEPQVPTLAWVGRVDPLKDLETLIRAFALVHGAEPRARLRLFGGTPKGNEGYRTRMVALAQELGVQDAVAFEGRIERIHDAYAAGNVVVLTSISEGFPYTVIEAMSCGRATVSTDVGGVAEAVGEAGLVVPSRDSAAVAHACLELLRDGERRGRLGALARQRVIDLFTVEQSLDVFRAIYADIGEAAR